MTQARSVDDSQWILTEVTNASTPLVGVPRAPHFIDKRSPAIPLHHCVDKPMLHIKGTRLETEVRDFIKIDLCPSEALSPFISIWVLPQQAMIFSLNVVLMPWCRSIYSLGVGPYFVTSQARKRAHVLFVTVLK